jgi:glycosyltransferase involved in cell wall biosynthesis
MPKVSIITCTYNRAHLIGETIRSVLAQTFYDFEFLIIDDGSTDKTEEVVGAFADKRIRYFKHPHTEGKLTVLGNYAHTKCSGEYIAYVDSDDLWESRKLEIQISKMERDPLVGFSFTDIETFDSAGIVSKNLYHGVGEYTGSVFEQMLYNELVVCHTTLVMRASCLKRMDPMDESKYFGDHEQIFFLSRYFNAHIVFAPMARVRRHVQNLTNNASVSLRLLDEHAATLKKALDKGLIGKKEFRRASVKINYSFGIQAQSAGDYKAARKFYLRCLSYWPFHGKAWMRCLMLLVK